ncbi:protein GRAVITROPIC IN THE LIGHT 1 [Punica granatum]|uniref:Protein GRAVITROPIC IN THE LIGHT 1 n=2 Tax=Punica granatum TaxID=22663 RepID=A0A6P8DGK6_PUNGR|nr:protein GRAVITROPIC IN THE LIGHT 1 [Punica granatum]PKI48718.1 hypothetical protein CRG98_030884 [Punica granatum]
MPDINNGSTNSKPPQISEMFQKFALAFKAKTFELFADEGGGVGELDLDGLSLLDSADEVITGQRVVVIKPDNLANSSLDSPQSTLSAPQVSDTLETQLRLKEGEATTEAPVKKREQSRDVSPVTLLQAAPLRRAKTVSELELRALSTQMSQILITSVFATVSSFEASYLQLQTAHVPFDEEGIKSADKALVLSLQRLSAIKQFFREFCKNPELGLDLPLGSCLEAQVQENQNKLRTLGMVSNRLQLEIDQKDNEVQTLRKKLGDIQKNNLKLSKRLSDRLSTSCEISLTVRVFDSVLHDACRAINRFTKILTSLMRRAGWDLNLASNSVYCDVIYAEKEHNRYAFLSYVCLVLFRGFDSESFGMDENAVFCNGHDSDSGKSNGSLKGLLEHISSNPMEVLSMEPNCAFARFCEKKYQELIHPSMESSIFRDLDGNEAVLSSWRSLTVFYKSFVMMASSVWTLHKLGFSFDPVVEIFQVERGVEYSMVYMEDVLKRSVELGRVKPRVGFTVVPGFKIGSTIVQSKVYLLGLNCGS